MSGEVEMERWRERVRRDQERVTQCGEEENLRETGQLVGKENDWMEVVDWADDPDLKGFEDRFYSVGGGRAGGVGFRRT